MIISPQDDGAILEEHQRGDAPDDEGRHAHDIARRRRPLSEHAGKHIQRRSACRQGDAGPAP